MVAYFGRRLIDAMEMNLDGAVRVSVADLAVMWNPLENPVWDDEIVSYESVERCLAYSIFQRRPVPVEVSLAEHAARIAWLICEGWNDPICVDVGIPDFGRVPDWPIIDGNHRLAAAIFRNDDAILANMSGCVDTIAKFIIPEL